MLKRVLINIVALGFLGILGLGALAWRPAIAPIAPPAAGSFAPALVAKGAALASAGNCADCHTAKGGPKFAGGYAIATAIGAIYSTNITPDPETGIGTWSEAAFARAMREGVAQDGSLLFPAFPYDHFTKLSDDDVNALYAYFMTRAPIRSPEQENSLPFPLNIRYLQAGWRLLFFRAGRFEPDASKSAEWNRGAYLAQALSHCGACHTPRNRFGSEKTDKTFAGASIDNWIAPPLTDANPSPVPWTQDELFSYLRKGDSHLHGSTAGPMAPVVHGLSTLSDQDIQALATYLADIDHAANRSASVALAVARAVSTARLGAGRDLDPGARLYSVACAYCHYNSRHLALNSALNLSDPTNLIQVVLHGVNEPEGLRNLAMPAFAQALSDADIAHLADYLRRTRTTLPPWKDLDAKVAAIRRLADAPQK